MLSAENGAEHESESQPWLAEKDLEQKTKKMKKATPPLLRLSLPQDPDILKHGYDRGKDLVVEPIFKLPE